MSSPYRESSAQLLCPRCGEMLEAVFAGVAACMQCQGAWIAQPTLENAFGNRRWPVGQSMWWHDELECPECLISGIVTKMNARGSGDVRVDACASHGLWLDRGELTRLLGLDTDTDELLELQHRISASAPEDLSQRRRAWTLEREARRKAAALRRAELEELQKRRAAELAEEGKRRRLDPPPPAPPPPPPVIAPAVLVSPPEDPAVRAEAVRLTEEHRRRVAEAHARSIRDTADREERNEVRARIAQLRASVKAGRADLKVLQREVAEKHAAIAAHTEILTKHTQELAGLEARLGVLDERIGP